MLSPIKKVVAKRWRLERVGLSATIHLARFADPRLHVINRRQFENIFSSQALASIRRPKATFQ